MSHADCGGCNGLSTHRRLCPHHPDYTPWLRLAVQSESIGDSVGSNNAGLANRFYAASSELRTMHLEALAVKRAREQQPPA